MAGTVAAIAAGRAGVRTMLIERWGFLGGAATAAAVGGFVGWETHSGRQVVEVSLRRSCRNSSASAVRTAMSIS